MNISGIGISAGLHFVFSELVKRGYPRAGVLAACTQLNGRQSLYLCPEQSTLVHNKQIEAANCQKLFVLHREALLALGWLLAQTKALQRSLNIHTLQYKITALLPPYPQVIVNIMLTASAEKRCRLQFE